MKWSCHPDQDREPSGEFDDTNVGPAQHMFDLKTPREVFEQFITPDMIKHIVRCTNVYGERYFEKKQRKEAWKPVTDNEMWSFIAILIATGRNKQNHMSINLLWTRQKPWRIDFYSYAMGQRRFKLIYVCLRFDDIRTRAERIQASGDKLEPIKTISDMFVANRVRNYIPPKILTVDERLCLFRGKYIYTKSLEICDQHISIYRTVFIQSVHPQQTWQVWHQNLGLCCA